MATAKKVPAKKAKLPAALAKNAEAAAKAKNALLVAEARQDIALIRRRRAEINEAFYDIGEALARLKRPDVYRAHGAKNWESFCVKQLEMSVTQADRLVDIVSSMTREQALTLGSSTRAASVAALVAATPEGDTVADLLRAGVVVRGKKIDVQKASSRELARASRQVRKRSSRSGRTLTDADLARGAALEKALRKGEAKDARVVVKAGPPGRGSRIEIEVELAHLELLRKLLAKA